MSTLQKRACLLFMMMVGGLVFDWLLPGNCLAEEKGLVGYWSFDEGSGNTAKDLSGNGNDGTISGAEWADGKIGKCLNFNGVGACVGVLDSAFSVSFWAKPGEMINWTTWMGKYEGSDATRRGWVILRSNQNSVYMAVYSSDGVQKCSPQVDYTPDQWIHPVFVYEHPYIRAYKNGVLVGQTSVPESWVFASSSRSVSIGTAGYYYFKGLIDQVRVYNRVLKDNEIREQWLSDLSDKEKGSVKKEQEAMKLAIDELGNKIAELGNLLEQTEQKKIDVSRQKLTKNVAELLLPVFKDAENNLASLSDSCLKTEMKDALHILDKSIAETKYLLANPQKAILYPDTEVKDFRTLKITNGAIYVDGKPTFLNGFTTWIGTGYPGYRINRPCIMAAPLKFKKIGANLLGPIQNGNAKQVAEITKMARDYNLFVNVWCARFSTSERYKGIRDFKSHYLGLDPDHPLLEECIGKSLEEDMKYLSLNENPNILLYSFDHETILWGGLTDYGRNRYAAHLKEKYGDTANLNQKWHTDFSSFEEAVKKQESVLATNLWGVVLPDRPKDVIPERWYDWHSFQQSRLDRYRDFQSNKLKNLEPSSNIGQGAREFAVVKRPGDYPGPLMGKNLENVVRNSRGLTEMAITIPPFKENDPNPFYHLWTDENYFLQWLVQSYYYDFVKSIAPENGIFDPEHHQINGGLNWIYQAFPKQSAENTRTALYLGHLHGLVGHSLWADFGSKSKLEDWLMGKYLPRNLASGCLSGTSGYHIYNMPIAMDSWARTMLDLKRLAPDVIAFPQAQRQVSLLYSEASVIQEYQKCMPLLFKVYENLYFLNCPVGFVTEKMVQEGKLKDCSVLVIPGARYVGDETYKQIKSFAEKGKTVVIIGEDNLKYNEEGSLERDTSSLLSAKSILRLPVTFGREYFNFLEPILDKAGVERLVRVEKDGKPVWGIEARSTIKDGKILFYVINLNTFPVEVSIKIKGKKTFLNLISNEKMDITTLISLNPGDIVLAEERKE